MEKIHKNAKSRDNKLTLLNRNVEKTLAKIDGGSKEAVGFIVLIEGLRHRIFVDSLVSGNFGNTIILHSK